MLRMAAAGCGGGSGGVGGGNIPHLPLLGPQAGWGAASHAVLQGRREGQGEGTAGEAAETWRERLRRAAQWLSCPTGCYLLVCAVPGERDPRGGAKRRRRRLEKLQPAGKRQTLALMLGMRQHPWPSCRLAWATKVAACPCASWDRTQHRCADTVQPPPAK